MFSSSQITDIFTTDFLRDVNTNPKLVDFMKTIRRENFHTSPQKYNINIFVDFIYNFIDYKELLKSPHATEWHGISVKADGTKEEQEKHLKSQMFHIVRNIFTKQFHNENVDNTFSSFIKRIICNVIGDVCGGFTITDLRRSSKNQVDAMQHIRDNKKTDMYNYISKRLNSKPNGGFVVCLENDHGDVRDGQCINNLSEFNYLEMDKSIHKANQAKGIYFTTNFTVNEISYADICKSVKSSLTQEFIDKLDKYKNRFAVCEISNVDETGKVEDSFWFTKKYLIILHNKSVGTKKDIKNNEKEYACMRKLIDYYATKDTNVLVVGDFNLPLWGEDNGYLKLEQEDQKTYPVQAIYMGDHDTFMTKNLELYSTWNDSEVGLKNRTPDWMQNSQAGIGKRTIPEDGPRNYHTDMVFGNIKLNDGSKPLILESKLYPDPIKCCRTKIAFPLVSPELNWFSDHQSMEMTLNDRRGEDTAFTIDVLNTLSDCCSGQQHIKRIFNKKTVERVRQEFSKLLVDYVRMCITFDGNVIEHFQKTFNDEEIDDEEIDDEETDDEETDDEEKTNLSLGDIMTHNEYNIIQALIISIMLNYLLWIVLAFVKWLFAE